MEKLFLRNSVQGVNFELVEGLTSVGRNPTNDLKVSDAAVSSFHCELVVTGSSIVVRDLDSTNGTYIEGEPVREAILKPGQLLRLGNLELKLEAEEVRISIPEISHETMPTQTHLLDGSLACLNHPGIPALARCTQCQQAYCADCVHSVGLQGARRRLFCPACSNPCELLPQLVPEKKKRSFLGRLTQTIRIKFR